MRLYSPAQMDRFEPRDLIFHLQGSRVFFLLNPAVPDGGDPFIVEPEMVVWIPIAGIHYDSKYHVEPEKFRPERFLDSKGDLTWKITDTTTFMPFGIGPRICIARRFALL